MRSAIQAAYRHAVRSLPSPPDGHCAEAARMMIECLDGSEIGVRAYVAPNHPGPHYTVIVDGIEYDPTIGHANWSRRLHVPRGKLYVVSDRSPHRRWRRMTI